MKSSPSAWLSALITGGILATLSIASGLPDIDPALPTPTITPAIEAAAAASPEMLAAARRDLGLTRNQFIERRAREDAARPIADALRDQLGDRFGGTWLTGNADQLVVAVTDHAAATAVWAAGAKARLVERGEAELKAMVARLDRQTTVPRGVLGWAPDLKSNVVVLQVAPNVEGAEEAALAFAAASGLDLDAVRVRAATVVTRTAREVRAGDGIRLGIIGGATGLCTAGFGVVRDDGAQGILTAGHCGPAGTLLRDGIAGFVALSIHPSNPAPSNGDKDFAFVELQTPFAVSSPIVNAYQSGLIGVVGETTPFIGQVVCTSGSTVGLFVCRTVDGLNEPTFEFDANGNPINRVTGQIRLSGCATGGDSGGPALAGSRAVGLVVSATCGVAGATSQATFAQPLQPLLSQNGLRLLTVGNPTAEPLRIESAGCGPEQTGPGFVCFARWAGGVDPATASWAVYHPRPTPYVITNVEARMTEAHFACDFNEAEPSYFTQVTIRDSVGTRVSWSLPVCVW